MFENRILLLALQLLVSFSESQILQNQQAWNYKNFEGLHTQGLRQYSGIHQPLTVQAQIQSIAAVPKCTSENIPPNPATNVAPYTNDNIPSAYDSIIRKYESMSNNPNVVNNYYILPPEPYKRPETNHRNRKYKDNVSLNSRKGEKKRRKKENSPSHYDGKEKIRRQYRYGNEYKSKKVDNEPLEHVIYDDSKSKSKESNQNTNVEVKDLDESVEIQNARREERDKGEHSFTNRQNKIMESNKPKNEKFRSVNAKESQNLSEKEKLLNFGENHNPEESFSIDLKQFDEEHRHTRNLKPPSTIERETKYTNPQDEFNKYMQNIMNGNYTVPYYANDMFPYNFDSFYKAPQTGEPNKPKNKGSNKRKSSKKSNKRNKTKIHNKEEEKNKEDECNTVIELSPTVYESHPITISTGASKDIYLNLKIKKNDSNSNDKSVLKTESNDKHEEEYLESNNDDDEEYYNKPLTVSLYEASEDEDSEYYPDFRLLNHAYLTSSEEEELNKLQKNHNQFQKEWDYYSDKIKSYVEQSNKKPSLSRSHVGLESATIGNKKENQSSDKSNSNNNKNVETIYAPSRVISYNKPEKKSYEDSDEDQMNLWFKEGDTTVVLSRSIE